MSKKILILTGGPLIKLDAFKAPAKDLGLDTTLASFYDIEFFSERNRNDFVLKVQGVDIAGFELIYIRMVGKRMEDATLVVNYAKQKGISLVDEVYETSLFIPSTISKGMETKKLIEAGINIPQTYFGSLYMIRDNAPELLDMPFVIKSTSGKKARDAWLIKNLTELTDLINELRIREKTGVRFFAQTLIRASQRVRVLVVGEKVLGAVTRPTKWRKHFTSKVNNEYPEGKKEALIPVPKAYSELAIAAARAADLDISGVDILVEDKTNDLFVIEANAAPSWNLIKKDTGVDVEKEILKFLAEK